MARASAAAMPASPRQRGPAQPLVVRLLAWLMAMQALLHARSTRLRHDQGANFSGRLSAVLGTAFVIVIVVVGAVVGAQTLAAVLPDYFDAGTAIVDAFTGASVNNTLADTILDLMVPIIAILIVVAPIGLVAAIFTFNRFKTSGSS